jgi:hypothetical protein
MIAHDPAPRVDWEAERAVCDLALHGAGSDDIDSAAHIYTASYRELYIATVVLSGEGVLRTAPTTSGRDLTRTATANAEAVARYSVAAGIFHEAADPLAVLRDEILFTAGFGFGALDVWVTRLHEAARWRKLRDVAERLIFAADHPQYAVELPPQLEAFAA